MLRRLSWVCSLSFLLTSNLINYPTPTFTAVQTTEEVDSVIKRDCRNFYDEYLSKYEEVQIQKEIQKQLEEERLRQEELERQRIEEEKGKLINKLGYEPSKIVKVNCVVTFYYADCTILQGGYNDKKGVPLSSHDEPIVALPSDVTYGSYIEFDKEIRGYTRYKCVDAGGAIRWLDDNTIVVDVFVPEASSYNELINMVENTTTTATIYYK